MRSSVMLALAAVTSFGLGWSALATEHAPSADRTPAVAARQGSRVATPSTDDNLPVTTDKPGVPGTTGVTAPPRALRTLRNSMNHAPIVGHIGRLK